jgi:tetratricopeptide (TPR) repeat protein
MRGKDYGVKLSAGYLPCAAPKETMKPFKLFLLGLALTLAHSSFAAEDKNTVKPNTRDIGQPAMETRTARQDGKNRPELNAQLVYQILIAEVALQRGRGDFATQAYTDLAMRTRDTALIARAVEVAGYTRRYERVLELTRLWLEIDPDSKRAQQVLASVMVMTNQFDGLAPHLIRMLEADKEALPGNLLSLNRMFARSPDRQAVLQLMNKVCAPFSNLAEAHYAVAVAAAAAQESGQALAETRKALQLKPDWEAAALLEAQIFAQSSASAAIDVLQGFLTRHPKAREIQLHLARALVAEKRYPEAKRHFQELLAAYPNNPDIVFPVAILALQQNDRPLAEAQLKHLVTLDIADKNPPYFYLGQLFEEDKRDDAAVDAYRQVIPGEHYLQAQLRSANIVANTGKLDLARSQLRAAAAASPAQRTQFTIGEATLLREAKQVEAAFDLLDKALRQEPEQPDLLYESALLAEKLGRMTVTETRLRKLMTLQPDNAQAYNALGYSYAERNMRLPEARRFIEKALQLAPNDPFILDSMGWVLYRQGDLEGALSHLERAHAQRPDPEIAAHIGEILWKLGRKDDARRTFQDALKRNPGNDVLTDAAKKFAD